MLVAVSGVPGLLLGRRSSVGQWIACALNVAGSVLGGVGVSGHLLSGAGAETVWAWSLPIGRFAVGVDSISALFLIPILLVSALGSIYGLEYWKQSEHPANGRKLRLAWGVMTAGMMIVVMARDGALFLMAWEVMAIAAFFLVATEDHKPAVRQAAWFYLVAAHVGTLSLFAFFALLRYATGSFALWPDASTPPPAWATTALFLTGLVGFGLKAGIMPLHVWLPGAHANAPSHVSAILSGVLLKTGVYGLVRVTALLPHPPIWWGGTLLAAGAVSAVLGIAFAASQKDFKRLLAYSSIENVGIIVMGLGLAVVGRGMAKPEWVVLGLGGAMLHMLNHSLFKPLLFMVSGNVVHACHTREIDLLGGLAKTMPRTFILFMVGAVAICGLPPLNGFVGELLIYLGLLRTAIADGPSSWPWAALGVPALAVVGAIAIVAFVKLSGIVFAGLPRTTHADHAHDPGVTMLGPMMILACGCGLIGVCPFAMAGIIDTVATQWSAPSSAAATGVLAVAPLGAFGIAAGALWVLLAAGVWLIWLWLRRRPVAAAGTWDCGYVRPTPRMQYTGSSFSQNLVELFRWALWPREYMARLRGLFPRASRYHSEAPDTVLDRGILPAMSRLERAFAWARPIQRGPVQVYLLYVLAILFILLLLGR